jgi:hypothetical protein
MEIYESPRWRDDVWRRALLFHPLLFVAPLVAVCLILAAMPGGNLDHVAWGVLAIPLGAVASFTATVVMAIRTPRPVVECVLLVLLGLVASATALIIGFLGLLWASDIACHYHNDCLGLS